MFLRVLERSRSLAVPLGAFLLALPAAAHDVTYTIPLSHAQEVPPSGTGATGSATLVLDGDTGLLTISGSYTGLSSNQTLAHIHGPAPAGMNNGIVLVLSGTGGTSGTFSGTTTLNASQEQALESGVYYINVHTMNFSNGEIRGQICENAASLPRNAGTNPTSFTCAPPVFGGSFAATVDLSTTGHGFAMLMAFNMKVNVALGGGQRLLCLDTAGLGELLTGGGLGPVAGPTAVFSAPIPTSLSLCNFSFSTQALHFGGVTPFALSNARDLTLGF